MNTEIERIKSAVSKIAEDLAYALRHLSDPSDVRHSDKTHMEDLASRLEQISDDLQS